MNLRRIKQASVIHIRQYKEWRNSGIAFEFGDQSYTEPNRTMAAYTEVCSSHLFVLARSSRLMPVAANRPRRSTTDQCSVVGSGQTLSSGRTSRWASNATPSTNSHSNSLKSTIKAQAWSRIAT